MKLALASALTLAPSLALAGGPLVAGGLVQAVITLLVVGLVCWLLLWLVDYAGVPEPFSKVAKILIVVVGVLFVINLLLSLTGVQIF